MSRLVCTYCSNYISYNNGHTDSENAGQCPCMGTDKVRLTSDVSCKLLSQQGVSLDGEVQSQMTLSRDGHQLERIEHLEVSDYKDYNLDILTGHTSDQGWCGSHGHIGCYLEALRETHNSSSQLETVVQQSQETQLLTSQATSGAVDIEEPQGTSPAQGELSSTARSIIPLANIDQFKRTRNARESGREQGVQMPRPEVENGAVFTSLPAALLEND